jgi:NAD(P)-dependent dehydrogenase (short-subunit alcohol dehydrogenase family)
MSRLTNRSILITGAASGIGRAIALRFAGQGARLLLADITTEVREGGTPTIDLLRTQGCVADHLAVDISREDQAQEAIDFLCQRDGRIDVLVNNAAINTGTPLTETSLETWQRVLGINLTGTFLMSRAAVAAMLAQTPDTNEVRGRLINIASQHGMVACPGDVAYGTSKAAIAYLTKQIAVDYADRGIICNGIAPGKILTGKTGRAVAPEQLAYSHARTPMPRLGRPGDVANAALFLASDEATFITGDNLMVDGGWMAG